MNQTRIRSLIAAAMGALALAPLLAGCDARSGTETEATRPDTRVSVALVAPAPGLGDIAATGTTAFKREVPVSFLIAGIVQDINVDQGDRVKPGDHLARLDPGDIAARLREADAGLAKANRDVARLEPLASSGFASKARLDDARTAVQAARATRDSVAFNRGLADIIAPANAVVLRRTVEPGQILAAGTPVLVLGDMDRGHIVVAGLADRDVVRVMPGDRAEARISGISTPFSGKVSRIAAKAASATGVFDVEITLDPTDRVLSSGLVASLLIHARPENPEAVLAIPAGAIVEGFGQEAQVFVVDAASRQATRRRIVVAGIDDAGVRITSGLRPGEMVVTAGAAYLREGDRVALTDTAEAAAPSSSTAP